MSNNTLLGLAAVIVGAFFLFGYPAKRRWEKIEYLNLSKLGPKNYTKWSDDDLDFVYEIMRRVELIQPKDMNDILTEIEKAKLADILAKNQINLS